MRRSFLRQLVVLGLLVFSAPAMFAQDQNPQRTDLKPGPRTLTEKEQSFVRDSRAAYIAQAKNDAGTFARYVADEYFAFDLGSNDIRTKRRFIEAIKEAAAANTSTIEDNRLPRPEDPTALRKNETLVIGDNTAVQVLTGGRIGDVPVRLQIVWIFRSGRWQRLTEAAVPMEENKR